MPHPFTSRSSLRHTSADGSYIPKSVQTCQPSAVLLISKQWPKQPRPGPIHIKAWQRFLKSQCKDAQYNLVTPLGPWKTTISQQQWSAYYDRLRNHIIISMDGSWQCYQHHTEQRRYWACSGPPVPHNGTHKQCIPIDIIQAHRDHIHVSIPSQSLTIPRSPDINTPLTWEAYVSKLPQWEMNLISNVHHRSTTPLRIILTQPITIYIVSDGSVKSDNGSFGWVMASSMELLCTNHGQLPPHSMNSFRAECGGILSWLVFLRHYMHHFGIHRSPCTIRPYCDNQSTLANTSSAPLSWKQARALRPHYDISNEIRSQFKQVLISCPLLQPSHHVKSHQDTSANQTYQEKLNIYADALANEGHQDNTTTHPVYLPSCAATLLTHDSPIHSNETNHSRWNWRETELQRYYEHRFQISTAQLYRINWNAIKTTLSTLPPQLHIFTTKLITGWLPIGT
jgi:hypothetical protein